MGKELIAENTNTPSPAKRKYRLEIRHECLGIFLIKTWASYADNMTYAANGGNTNLSEGISVQYKTGKKYGSKVAFIMQNGRRSVFIRAVCMKPEQEMVFASGNLYLIHKLTLRRMN